MSNTTIVACGVEQDIGCRVIKWNDPGGFDLYSAKKYAARNCDLAALRQTVKTFTLHHSVSYTARATYLGLIARGLSVNFIIDDNVDENGYATIYQCLDIKDAGQSQKPLNLRGSGVEISFYPLVKNMAQAYSVENQKKYGVTNHEISDDIIHGQKIRIFKPADAQVKSIISLLRGYCELFPDIPNTFPKNSDGTFIKTIIPNLTSYEGLLNHYNITRDKIDCVGLDLKYIEDNIR
jgi:hypothetical protein